MAKEIERKFLITSDTYKEMAHDKVEISQCYLSKNPDTTVRVRRMGDKGFLTVKSRNIGAVRGEWEYEIPEVDAIELANIAGGWSIMKTRYMVPYGSHIWTVDEFHGPHQGLVVAEVELEKEDEAVEVPPFIGREVTGDASYYNSAL